MIYEELKKAIVPGLEFSKPSVKSTILKTNNDGFYYSVGQNGNSKKVSYPVFEESYKHFLSNGSFSRQWFNDTFPEITKAASCRFTTIGGLFQQLGLAKYQKVTYIKEV